MLQNTLKFYNFLRKIMSQVLLFVFTLRLFRSKFCAESVVIVLRNQIQHSNIVLNVYRKTPTIRYELKSLNTLFSMQSFITLLDETF